MESNRNSACFLAEYSCRFATMMAVAKHCTAFLWRCEEWGVTMALYVAATRNLYRAAKFLYVQFYLSCVFLYWACCIFFLFSPLAMPLNRLLSGILPPPFSFICSSSFWRPSWNLWSFHVLKTSTKWKTKQSHTPCSIIFDHNGKQRVWTDVKFLNIPVFYDRCGTRRRAKNSRHVVTLLSTGSR